MNWCPDIMVMISKSRVAPELDSSDTTSEVETGIATAFMPMNPFQIHEKGLKMLLYRAGEVGIV